MLRKYREIIVGVLFGLGACLIDTLMHAQMMDRAFLGENSFSPVRKCCFIAAFIWRLG